MQFGKPSWIKIAAEVPPVSKRIGDSVVMAYCMPLIYDNGTYFGAIKLEVPSEYFDALHISSIIFSRLVVLPCTL
jgi:hypothetical protein